MNDTANTTGASDGPPKGGFRHGLVTFIYLWALFGLFVLNEGIVSREHGSPLIFHGFALLNALALTKVMMVSENFELSRFLSDLPRALTIAAEAALCTTLFLVAHCLQRTMIGLVRGENLSTSMPSFGGGGLTGLVIVALIFFVSLLPFFTVKMMARAIGAENIRARPCQKKPG